MKPNETAIPLAYDLRRAVDVSGLTRTRIFGAIAAGELAAIKSGRRTLIPADALAGYLAALPRVQPRRPRQDADQPRAA